MSDMNQEKREIADRILDELGIPRGTMARGYIIGGLQCLYKDYEFYRENLQSRMFDVVAMRYQVKPMSVYSNIHKYVVCAQTLHRQAWELAFQSPWIGPKTFMLVMYDLINSKEIK